MEALGTGEGEGRCHGVAERVRGAGAASANAAHRTGTKHKGQLGLGDALWGPLDISIAESRRVVMKGEHPTIDMCCVLCELLLWV